jgi:hypothetical protein
VLQRQTQSKELGPDHPHTLESMHELAVLYNEQELYDKAEPLLRKAVEGRREKLGNTHPQTQDSIKNLIETYEARGKPEEAKKWRAELMRTEGGEQ